MSEHESELNQHHHNHGDECECQNHESGYEHHQHDDYDEECECHNHDHEHEHHHDDDCECHDHEHHHVHGRDIDGIHIEHHTQDEACVISGTTTFCGKYDLLRQRIAQELENVAAAITAQEGIVGHVKAAAEVTQTEMFSVTDVQAMAKTAPTQVITLKMAAIVFAIEPETVEEMVEHALRSLKE